MSNHNFQKLLDIAKNQEIKVKYPDYKLAEKIPDQTINEISNGLVKISDCRRMTYWLYLMFNGDPSSSSHNFNLDLMDWSPKPLIKANQTRQWLCGEIGYVSLIKAFLANKMELLPTDFCTNYMGYWFICINELDFDELDLDVIPKICTCNDGDTMVLVFWGEETTFAIGTMEFLQKFVVQGFQTDVEKYQLKHKNLVMECIQKLAQTETETEVYYGGSITNYNTDNILKREISKIQSQLQQFMKPNGGGGWQKYDRSMRFITLKDDICGINLHNNDPYFNIGGGMFRGMFDTSMFYDCDFDGDDYNIVCQSYSQMRMRIRFHGEELEKKKEKKKFLKNNKKKSHWRCRQQFKNQPKNKKTNISEV